MWTASAHACCIHKHAWSVSVCAQRVLVQLLVSDPNELEDVNAEGMRVENLTDYGDHPIVIKDLKKIYPGLDGGKPKVGVVANCCGVCMGCLHVEGW